MRIRGCFSKPKGVREQEILGNTGLIDINNGIIILCNLVQFNLYFSVVHSTSLQYTRSAET